MICEAARWSCRKQHCSPGWEPGNGPNESKDVHDKTIANKHINDICDFWFHNFTYTLR